MPTSAQAAACLAHRRTADPSHRLSAILDQVAVDDLHTVHLHIPLMPALLVLLVLQLLFCLLQPLPMLQWTSW